MDRKRELKKKYLQTKPEMGVFIIRSSHDHKCYLEACRDLRGRMNSTIMKLKSGMHPNRELQQAWLAQGQENFAAEVLEILEYDENGVKTDYTEELAFAAEIWEEKLAGEKWEFYKKRLR